MFAILIFWVAMLLPGLSLASRLFSEDVGRGPLALLTLAYLCTLSLLTPVAILCYWARLPLWVFSLVVALVVIGSALDIALNSRFRWRLQPIGGITVACGAVIVADLILSSLYGGYLDGDAAYHMARIRMLLDHGFNNWDPYLHPHQFAGAYHTNLYHALIATASQLTGESFIQAWSTTLVWAKLITAGSHYYLGERMFASRKAGYIAALATTFWPYNALPIDNSLRWIYLVLPHNFAPLWLFPLLIGLCLDLVARPTKVTVLKLAMVVIVFAQIHALYTAYIILFVVPLVAGCVIYTAITQHSWRSIYVVAGLVCLLGVPFLIIGVQGGGFLSSTAEAKPLQIKEVNHNEPHPNVGLGTLLDIPITEIMQNAEHAPGGRKLSFVKLSDGRTVVDPQDWWDPRKQRFWLAIAILVCFCLRDRRVMILGYFIGVTILVLHHPSLFTALIQKGHLRPWALGRLDVILVSAGYVLIPNAVINLVALVFQRNVVYLVVVGFMLFLGVEPRAARKFDWHAIRRRTKVKHLVHERNVLQRFIPYGAMVLADVVEGKRLIQLHNSYVIVVNRLSPQLIGIDQRRSDLDKVLRESNSRADRSEVLNRYQVSYTYARSPETRRRLEQRLGNSHDWLYKEKSLAVGVIR